MKSILIKFRTCCSQVILLVLIGAVAIFSSRAQELCETLAREAFEAVKQNCETIGLNEACYGYDSLQVTFTSDLAAGTFDQPSDAIPTSEIYTIRSTGFSEEDAEWGIGYFRLPLNSIDGTATSDPKDALVIMVVGDVLIENAAVNPTAGTSSSTPSMYDFNFTTGGRSDCKATPNAVYIQTPKDVEVDLRVNGTVMRVGTTIILGTQTNTSASGSGSQAEMWTVVLEGDLLLNPGTPEEQIVPEGSYSSVPLDITAELEGEIVLDPLTGEPILGPDGQPFVRPIIDGDFAEPEILDLSDETAPIDYDSLTFVEAIPDELTDYDLEIPSSEDADLSLEFGALDDALDALEGNRSLETDESDTTGDSEAEATEIAPDNSDETPSDNPIEVPNIEGGDEALPPDEAP